LPEANPHFVPPDDEPGESIEASPVAAKAEPVPDPEPTPEPETEVSAEDGSADENVETDDSEQEEPNDGE